MSMDMVLKVTKSVPTRVISLVALILSCWLVYCVYAGEIRDVREAVIKQQATNDRLAEIAEGMDERLKWLERQNRNSGSTAPVAPQPRPTP